MSEYETVTFYGVLVIERTRESPTVSAFKVSRELILQEFKGQVLERTGQEVSITELDAEGRYRRIATGWGKVPRRMEGTQAAARGGHLLPAGVSSKDCRTVAGSRKLTLLPAGRPVQERDLARLPARSLRRLCRLPGCRRRLARSLRTALAPTSS